MRCSVWPIDLHRSSHRRARSRPLPCHSQRHNQCWQQGASLAVPSQGRILEAPRTPPEAAPARRSPAVAAATGNPGHSLASRIQVARGCSKNANDFGESKVSEYNFRKENLLFTGILVCLLFDRTVWASNIKMPQTLPSECTKIRRISVRADWSTTLARKFSGLEDWYLCWLSVRLNKI